MSTTETSSSRSRNWAVLTVIALVVLVCLGWAGAWIYAANRVEKELDAWITREAKAGRIWNCAERGLSGFPFRLELNCATPSLDMKSGEPLRMTATSARAISQVWSPNQIITEIQQPARIENKETGEVLGLTWQHLQVMGAGMTSGRPESFSIMADKPELTLLEDPAQDEGATPSALFSAASLMVSANTQPGAGPNASGALEDVAYALTLSGAQIPLLAQFGNTGPIDASMKGVVTAAANLRPMPLEQRLRAWAEAKGLLRLEQLTIISPDILAAATGVVSLNPQGQLNGAVDLSFAGVQKLMQQLGQAGVIPPQLAPIVGAITMVGRPTQIEGRKAVTFPLSFKDGSLRLSGLPVGRVPAAF
ncbi:DUF2125 domain-containing protein [Xanthobacter sp. TB0139]|uniref:DUF2125 domain-containing protein n=1 Tax=Xanthobacter sp. TB0139 TaxID=3459178 RepID=UPI00403A5B6C